MNLSEISFPSTHCNMGVLFRAVDRAEINVNENMDTLNSAISSLEIAIKTDIPTIEDQLEKFTKKKGYKPFSVVEKQLTSDELEESNDWENGVFVDFDGFSKLAETVYLINFAYNFFFRYSEFKEIKGASLKKYVELCADHAFENVLKGTQAIDYRFTDASYAQEVSVMAALRPMMCDIDYLCEGSTIEEVSKHNSRDGVRCLLNFTVDIRDNLLYLFDDYLGSANTYIY